MGAAERQEDNTWAGTLILLTGDNPGDGNGSRISFTMFVDFDDQGPDFWLRGVDRRFRILTNTPEAMEAFFAYSYEYISELVSDATKRGGRLPKRGIGFVWDQ